MTESEEASPADGDEWDMPPRASGIPVLHLDGFDGPMDLLLDLAERQRIDLGRMSVLALAEQFVAALEEMADKIAIERRADWLVLATRLVLLRSRLLFPSSPQAAIAAEQEAADALHRMATMVEMRAAASWLQARPQLGVDVLARPLAMAPAHEGGYVALIEACLVALRGRGERPEQATAYRLVLPDLWRVSDALARIRAILAEESEQRVLEAFLPTLSGEKLDRPLKARAAVASTFLAGLELAREGVLTLEQEGHCTAVYFQRSAEVVRTES